MRDDDKRVRHDVDRAITEVDDAQVDDEPFADVPLPKQQSCLFFVRYAPGGKKYRCFLWERLHVQHFRSDPLSFCGSSSAVDCHDTTCQFCSATLWTMCVDVVTEQAEDDGSTALTVMEAMRLQIAMPCMVVKRYPGRPKGMNGGSPVRRRRLISRSVCQQCCHRRRRSRSVVKFRVSHHFVVEDDRLVRRYSRYEVLSIFAYWAYN